MDAAPQRAAEELNPEPGTGAIRRVSIRARLLLAASTVLLELLRSIPVDALPKMKLSRMTTLLAFRA